MFCPAQIKESEEITASPPTLLRFPTPSQNPHLHLRSHVYSLLLLFFSPSSSSLLLSLRLLSCCQEGKDRACLHPRRLRWLQDVLGGQEGDGLHGRSGRDDDRRGCLLQLPELGVAGSDGGGRHGHREVGLRRLPLSSRRCRFYPRASRRSATTPLQHGRHVSRRDASHGDR